MKAEEWPEPLPPASPPPQARASVRRGVGITDAHDADPGHVRTAGEWAAIVRRAEEADGDAR